MPNITLNFPFDINVSAQQGDTAYYVGAANISTPTGTTLESAETSSIVEIGEITSLDKNTTSTGAVGSHIVCDTTLGNVISPNYYILFSKNNSASLSSILGYYAEIKMTNTNNSTDDAELFQIGLDVFESSK